MFSFILPSQFMACLHFNIWYFKTLHLNIFMIFYDNLLHDSGGSKGGRERSPPKSYVDAPRELAPPPRGNPGSATAWHCVTSHFIKQYFMTFIDMNNYIITQTHDMTVHHIIFYNIAWYYILWYFVALYIMTLYDMTFYDVILMRYFIIQHYIQYMTFYDMTLWHCI